MSKFTTVARITYGAIANEGNRMAPLARYRAEKTGITRIVSEKESVTKVNRSHQIVGVVVAAVIVAGASILYSVAHASTAPPSVRAQNRSPLVATRPDLLRTASPRWLRAASGTGHVGQLSVPFPLPPGCTFQPLTQATVAPAGATTAVLSNVPSDLGHSAGVEYTPCSPVPSHALMTPYTPGEISFHIVSVTQYEGTAGTIQIGLDIPSAAAVAAGLSLGDPAGSLTDGATLYVQYGSDPQGAVTLVQWMDNGAIVTLSSNDVPASRLKALADTVTVR